jgi:hypothetical protein
MGQQLVNKAAYLAQITGEINKCNAYLKMTPDPFAASRVQALESNPCISGIFYLNAIYKDSQIKKSEEAAVAYRKQKTL